MISSGWVDRRSVLAFVDGGRSVVTASKTGELRLWDLTTGRLVNTRTIPLNSLHRSRRWLQELAISPDGKTLAGAVVADGSDPSYEHYKIILWDISKMLGQSQQGVNRGDPPEPLHPRP